MTDENAIEVIKSECYVFNPLDLDRTVLINQALDRAVDVLKRRAGKWIIVEEDAEWFEGKKGTIIQCEDCKFIHTIPHGSKIYNFCPKCGRQMEDEETEEECNRRLCRENYAAQMESLGYDADGNPNNQNGGCYKAHEMIEDRLHCKCGCEMVITGEWEKYDHCPKCGAKVEVYVTPWDRNRKR